MVQHIKFEMSERVYSKWKGTVVFQNMFAREHILCDKVTGFYPTGSGTKQIQFEIPKVNDMIDRAYIQSKWPALQNSGTDLECYVWGLGYAFWQSIEWKIGNTKIAHEPSDYMEVMDELCSPPGRVMREMVFKHECVSWHNLAKLSSTPFTLYTPLRLWFTQTPGNAIALSGIKNATIDAVLHVRKISDFCASVPFATNAITDSSALPNVASGDQISWANADIDINLMLGIVTLPDDESQYFFDHQMHYLITAYQSTIGPTEEKGLPFAVNSDRVQLINHPFKYPCRYLVFAIADANRTSLVTTQATGVSLKPWTSGVRALYGDRVSASEFNVLDDGCVIPETFADGAKFSAGIKKFDANRGNGPWLPKNRYDYRMADEDGNEIEPLKQLTVKFSGDHRIEETLDGYYFRSVQPLEHFSRIPRKGIYTLSFDDDSVSPVVYSSCANLTQLVNVEFTFVAGRASTQENPLELHYWIAHWQVLHQHQGQIHPKYNG